MSGSTVQISLVANASNAVKGFRETTKAADSMGSKFKGLGSLLKTGLAVGGVAALGGFLGGAIKDSIDGAKALRVLNSQIKNLGASGKAAFSDADSFANSFGRSIGQDDDKVRAVETKLASFPDAFKKGSLGADGMKRSVKAAFDLQAIGIGDAESNIIGIGKAMNDPIKGMSALSKSGVSFTKEQQTQIKNYVKQGNLAGAQNVLLKGIESNAKGAASAAASPFDKIKVAVSQIVGDMADRMLPTVTKVADFATNKLVPGFDKFSKAVGPAIGPVMDKISAGVVKLQGAIPAVVSGFQIFVGVLKNPVFQAFAAGVIAMVAAYKVYTAYLAIVAAATKAYAAVQAVLNVVMDANPIGIVILAIIGLIAVIVVLWKRSDTFRSIVIGTWNAIKVAAVAVFGFLKGFIMGIWNGIRAYFTTVFGIYRAIVMGAFGAIRATISGAMNFVRSVIPNAINGAKNGFIAGVNGIANAARSIRGKITGALSGAASWLYGIGRNIVEGLANGISNMAGAVADRVRSIVNAIPSAVRKILHIGSPSKVMAQLGEYTIQGFADGFQSVTGSDLAKQLAADLTRQTIAAPGIGAIGASGSAYAQLTSAGRASSGMYIENLYIQVDPEDVQAGKKIVDKIKAYKRLNPGVVI